MGMKQSIAAIAPKVPSDESLFELAVKRHDKTKQQAH